MVNFNHRAEPQELPELIDQPCSFEEYRERVAELEKLNKRFHAYRPTMAWLEQFASTQETLRILDVGSGGGDMLRQIGEWAHARKIPVALTGLDLNPDAARAAVYLTCPRMGIEWVTGDVFSYEGEADIVISSLFTHHLATPDVVRFLAWSERVAQRGWFVNDLAREAVPYYAIGILSRLAGWHKFVQHDGPVSFRRAFREDDWQRMCSEAGVGAVEMRRWKPARLCVSRVK